MNICWKGKYSFFFPSLLIWAKFPTKFGLYWLIVPIFPTLTLQETWISIRKVNAVIISSFIDLSPKFKLLWLVVSILPTLFSQETRIYVGKTNTIVISFFYRYESNLLLNLDFVGKCWKDRATSQRSPNLVGDMTQINKEENNIYICLSNRYSYLSP